MNSRNSSEWMDRAKCRDLTLQESAALFFPEKQRLYKPAAAYCSTCPVVAQCLQYAIANDEHGIWAGTPEKHRRRMSQITGTPQKVSTYRAKPRKRKVVRRDFRFS